MKKIVSCAYNMDSGCVELRYTDGSMYSIDCTAVENLVARNMYERSELVSFALCLKRDALPITQPAKDSLKGLKMKCSMVAPGKRSHLTIFVRSLTAISIGTTINVSRYRWAG